MEDGWQMDEPGWHTNRAYGGIVRLGSRNWMFYPIDSDDEHGPYKTLKAAKEAAVIVSNTDQ